MMRYKLLLLFVLVMPSLQGCFPVVAGGAAAGAAVAGDRRTSGTYLEDQSIEMKAGNRISDTLGDKVHINITSYNRVVLLTGEAPTQELRDEVERIVRSVPNVRAITNEVAIAGISTLSARSNDSYLTSKVKARFIDASKFQPLHVKVVTESGVVYLMGLVTQQEAKDAADIASATEGVKKVVKLFEYLD
jgi:osmotically-inducible protein OsmY